MTSVLMCKQCMLVNKNLSTRRETDKLYNYWEDSVYTVVCQIYQSSSFMEYGQGKYKDIFPKYFWTESFWYKLSFETTPGLNPGSKRNI